MIAAGKELAEAIAARLREHGHQAFLVGGCVRDLLLGREPKDFDVATSAPPEVVLSLFPDAQQVGAHFGVVHVRSGGAQVEVATFRSDYSYHDGRRPGRVEFETDPREDARRRDFTINALLLDPATGAVLDFVGGRKDLEARIVRAIGDPDARFREDHLRMLRAVRIAAAYGFEIEPATLEAIRRNLARIHRVAAERVRDELARILTEGGARRGFELLDETALLEQILPEIAAMKGVPQPPQYHPEGDVWIHTRLMLEQMREPSLTLALGVLLHDVGKPPTFEIADRIRFNGHAHVGARMAVNIMSRLRFGSAEIRRVEMLVAQHSKFQEITKMRESTLKRFLRQDGFPELLELHRIDCLASHRQLANYEFARHKLAEYAQEQLKPAPLITGRDLISAGYQPGPRFKQILQAVEDAQLESRIQSQEEAFEFVRRQFPADGPDQAGL